MVICSSASHVVHMSSDDHGAVGLPEAFHCVLCRTPARAGACCRHVCRLAQGKRWRAAAVPYRVWNICGSRRVAALVFLAIVDLFYVRGVCARDGGRGTATVSAVAVGVGSGLSLRPMAWYPFRCLGSCILRPITGPKRLLRTSS